MPDPFFDEEDGGCVVYDDSYGYLGNVNMDCPTDVYLQQALCIYMISTVYPIEQSSNPFKRPAYPQAPPPQKVYDNNFTWDFDDTDRSLVVLGSSMLSTHFQENNGEMCDIGSDNRPETRFDERGMPGNDFYASPAYLFPWSRAYAGARTGFNSGNVRSAGVGTPDACKVAWGFPKSPMDSGVDWLNGKPNPVMITDGGLINDLKSSTGGWSDTLKALVACQAMQKALPEVNNWLDKFWADENEFDLRFMGKIFINGKWVEPKAPQMRVAKTLKGGAWTDALDVPAGQQLARCGFAIESTGNGIIIGVHKAMTSLSTVSVDVPAILPLEDVSGNLKAIKAAYRGVAKQIWLQYPRMDKAMVSIKIPDIAIFLGGEVARELIDAVGLDQTITVGVVEPQLQGRVAKISDDINRYMYNAIGCDNTAAYVTGHGPVVCESDGNKPMVVITRDAYPDWNFQDHQTTIAGGMPHESASGQKKLGNGLIEADSKPAP